ncbi:hypothetical protein PLGE761_15715 [Pluralibacter gergoviae]|uniref:hypothetical protein n=1 Tax=Pluralibacter gergoviae TaxID=61647 RepID=UPI0007DABA35|nr:hypothetical protein [Pluralibacter gergoviae]SUB71387.1 Uncharacterised protein [Pluralibacter gergoviae]
MEKQRPLAPVARSTIRHLAAAFVCAELETQVIAKFLEEKTGKPYDRNAPDSYLNTFLSAEPEIRRAWRLLQKDIAATRKDFAARMEKERA